MQPELYTNKLSKSGVTMGLYFIELAPLLSYRDSKIFSILSEFGNGSALTGTILVQCMPCYEYKFAHSMPDLDGWAETWVSNSVVFFFLTPYHSIAIVSECEHIYHIVLPVSFRQY